MMGRGKKEEEEEKSSHKNKINLHYLPVGDQTKVVELDHSGDQKILKSSG